MIYTVLFPFLAGILIWLIFKNKTSDKDRSILSNMMIGVSVTELAMAIFVLTGSNIGRVQNIFGVGGLGIGFAYSGFRGIFGVLTAFAWFVTHLFSKEYMKDDKKAVRYDLFNLCTLGATMGIFYAADLFTVFFFFEIMSFTSFMWVAHKETGESLEASGVYLGIAIAGGLSILMGLFVIYSEFGTLKIGELSSASESYFAQNNALKILVASICMLVGFGAKASAFPVHAWLPKSYICAPEPASALLSAVLSKTGVFGIILVTVEVLSYNGNWGMLILVTGVITMVLGGIHGVTSDNFKTTIAYSSMSQIGFIMTGVGMQGLLSEILKLAMSTSADHTEMVGHINEAYNLAVNGTMLHMINHSVVKLVLFMITGVVFLRAGSFSLNVVKGFGHKKPFLMITFLLAAAGVGGIPLLNGYVSKTLLHESIVEYTHLLGSEFSYLSYTTGMMKGVEYLFLFSGGLTVAYMTKLFVVLFVEKNDDLKLQQKYEADIKYASVFSKAAIGICAVLVPVIGLVPNVTADAIAAYGYDFKVSLAHYTDKSVNYFSMINLSGALISIVAGALIYIVVVRVIILKCKKKGYVDIYPSWINMEKYVYRIFLYRAVPFVMCIISRILDSIVDWCVVILRKTVYKERKLPYELPEGNYFTHKLGAYMEKGYEIYCGISKKEYEKKNYEHKVALRNTDFVENFKIIERSLSFGLFMFCVGLGLTLLYLLIVN